MQLYFVEASESGTGELNSTESRHCIKVMRHRVGDSIHTVDGRGNYFPATILRASPQKVELSLGAATPGWGEKSQQLALMLSPLRKRDRFEWAIEKAVELGVTEIQPILCERTVKTGFQRVRLEKILTSALKQCKRSRLPQLRDPQPLAEVLDASPEGIRYVATASATTRLWDERATIVGADRLGVLIGPEGDFTDAELVQVLEKGFIGISLGENRLRAETAAIHALSSVKMIQGW